MTFMAIAYKKPLSSLHQVFKVIKYGAAIRPYNK